MLFVIPSGNLTNKKAAAMEIVEIVSRAHFYDHRLGAVSRKQRFKIAREFAEYLAQLELVDIVSPITGLSVAPSTAPIDSGLEEPSASLPQGQASQESIAKPLRRGRKPKAG